MGREGLAGVCFQTVCIASMGFLLWRSTMACPADADVRIRECTHILSNLTESQHNYSEKDYCLTLERIPACLETILSQCREHHEAEVYESLSTSTRQWKLKFKDLCSWVHSSAQDHRPGNVVLLVAVLAALQV